MGWKVEAFLGACRRRDITGELMRSAPAAETLRYTPGVLAEAGEPASVRYLRISNDDLAQWRPMLVSPDCGFELRLNQSADLQQVPVRVVYFVNCYVNPRYLYMVTSQLKELLQTDLLIGARTTFYLVSSGTEDDRVRLNAEMRRILGDSQAVQHAHTTENQFEYPGIHKVWQLSQQDQQGYFLYFHARGISRLKLGRFRRNRQPQEKKLFRRVVGQWRQNLLWLQHVRSAEKLGMHCGGNGWIWFNFWWARASYVFQLEEPVRTDRRHYYEGWLESYLVPAGKSDAQGSHINQCLALAAYPEYKKFNMGSYFDPVLGETHLGMPWGRLKLTMTRLTSWLATRKNQG